MAKCAHCGGGKAKRPCPALGANICSRCCGQQQRKAIDCPSGCSFLRGAPKQDAYQSAVGKLLDFTMSLHEWCDAAAKKYFGKNRAMDEWEQPILQGYFAFGHEDDDGDRAIDIFVRERGKQLRADEMEAVDALRNTAWYSMFEVQEVKLDEGLDLLDLATGERFFVQEKAATHQLTKYALHLGWVVELGDHYELTGSLCSVPRQHRDQVLKALKRELKKARKADPEVPDKVLLRRTTPATQRALRKAVNDWQPPQLVTTDGEEIVFCEAIFDLTDADAARKRLREHPDVEEDDGAFVWLDHRGRQQLGGGPLLLGSIRLTDRRLVLETSSKERIEKGKEFLRGCLGDLVRHRLDSIKDLEVAMDEHRARGPGGPPQDEIPPEMQAELVSQFMQERLMAWIDEPIPMLDGKTPRQVARTKAGKRKVLDMIKDQEHIAQSMPGADRMDFSAVYAELGLRDG